VNRIKTILSLFAVLVALNTYSQDYVHSLGPLYFRPPSGEVSLENLFRRQVSLFNNIEENQNSLYFIGGIKLNLNSYLLNPDIVTLNISTEYNPESRDEKYLLVPDRSEVRTLKKFDARASVFSGKPVTVTAYANLNQSYYNRELLTNIKSNNQRLGVTLSLNNRLLPLSVSYRNTFWDQTETLTGRVFKMGRDNLESRLIKSFSEYDRHELSFSHENYDYTYSDLHNTKNKINRFRANNSIYLNKDRRNSFNSMISYIQQSGYYHFKKFEANERLIYTLSDNLKVTGRYSYHIYDNSNYTLNQQRIAGELDHKLFKSLRTNIDIEYASSVHDLYNETNLRAGGQVAYTKIIGDHRLNISYHHYRHYMDMKSESTEIIINNEEHIISDAEILLLDKPYAVPASVTVRDASGTIIYQEDLDYQIHIVNNFIEIERIPGGLISDNQAILVDYTAIQPGSYGFNSVYNNLSVGVMFFNNLFEIYYKGFLQDYTKVRDTEYLVLNYYTRNVYGARINLDLLTAGIEYDLYKSTIIPYERIRYYLNLNKSFKGKYIVALNCNVRDYRMIDDDIDHKYYNISARLGYNIAPRTKVMTDIGYLRQHGKNINLDLLTGKAEFLTSIRQFYIKAGVQNYIRKYLENKHIFFGTYIELSRKF